jgi:hypothetical protein
LSSSGSTAPTVVWPEILDVFILLHLPKLSITVSLQVD